MNYLLDGGLVMPERIQTTRKIAKGRRKHFTGQFTFGPDEDRTMDIESHTELCSFPSRDLMSWASKTKCRSSG